MEQEQGQEQTTEGEPQSSEVTESGETMATPTSSDVGKQTLTKADLGGRDVTKDEGALEEAIQRGNEEVAGLSGEDSEGYNPDAEVVENPTDARVEAEPDENLPPTQQ